MALSALHHSRVLHGGALLTFPKTFRDFGERWNVTFQMVRLLAVVAANQIWNKRRALIDVVNIGKKMLTERLEMTHHRHYST
jgi:hypothetical protein